MRDVVLCGRTGRGTKVPGAPALTGEQTVISFNSHKIVRGTWCARVMPTSPISAWSG